MPGSGYNQCVKKLFEHGMTHCQDMKSLHGQKRNYLDITYIKICDIPSGNQNSLHLRFWSFDGL